MMTEEQARFRDVVRTAADAVRETLKTFVIDTGGSSADWLAAFEVIVTVLLGTLLIGYSGFTNPALADELLERVVDGAKQYREMRRNERGPGKVM